MNISPSTISKVLFQSLTEGSLLLNDLPEARSFPCHLLTPPKESTTLNFQQKLGHLYEDALAVMLKSTSRYDTLAKGLQIRRETGQTIGELDFIVRDLFSGQLLHLELAVKFYLAVETGAGFLLPGPDARDNYFRKLEKMRAHQLMLVNKYPDLLPEKFRAEEIVVQQLIHGSIFDHVSASKLVEAKFLNPHGRRGKWMHAEECTEYFGHNTQLKVIPKPLWPVPLEFMDGIVLEKWQIDRKTDRCVMVQADSENIPYFIAPSGYPCYEPST